MVPIAWEAHRAKLQEKFGEERLPSTTTCVVYTDALCTLWCGDAFAVHMAGRTNFKLFPFPVDSADPESYRNQAVRRYHRFLARTGHTFCWFSVSINNVPIEPPIVFELFTDLCPRTCENFRHLCLGDRPDTQGDDPRAIRLHYKGTRVFRIVKDGWLQGGDIVNDRGNGGHSIFGPEFPDECFSMKHDAEGVLGMANNGKNTNASQFYITLARQSWMDGKYVAFGRIIEGLSVLHRMHAEPTKHNQMPAVPILIEDCGELVLETE
eukprot:EG_transcript_19946